MTIKGQGCGKVSSLQVHREFWGVSPWLLVFASSLTPPELRETLALTTGLSLNLQIGEYVLRVQQQLESTATVCNISIQYIFMHVSLRLHQPALLLILGNFYKQHVKRLIFTSRQPHMVSCAFSTWLWQTSTGLKVTNPDCVCSFWVSEKTTE